MIEWIAIASAILTPIITAAAVYAMCVRAAAVFRVSVLETLQDEVRKQDDRIRKRQGPEKARNDAEEVRIPPTESPDGFVLVPGQPIDWSR